VVATFAHLDAATVLSRRQVSLGLYRPLTAGIQQHPVDPGRRGAEHVAIANEVRAMLPAIRSFRM
jgi:F0F1-type ATP synthase beta subunit